MLRILKYGIFFAATLTNVAFAQSADKSDIYMDLGKVVVDSTDLNNLTYLNQTKTFIETLKSQEYKVNLIINFPDVLGDQVFNNCEEKLTGLIKFIDSKWQESDPFDWSQFDHIILPPKDPNRKPKPYTLVNALTLSCPNKAIFMSEDNSEIDMAHFLGLATYHVQSLTDPLIPTSEIENFASKNFRFNYPEQCGLQLKDQCVTPNTRLIELVNAAREAVIQ